MYNCVVLLNYVPLHVSKLHMCGFRRGNKERTLYRPFPPMRGRLIIPPPVGGSLPEINVNLMSEDERSAKLLTVSEDANQTLSVV